MRLRSTHTFVELEISDSAWHEIEELLRLAGYSHAIIDGRVIDMHGIGLTVRPEGEEELDGINQVLSDFCERWEGKR